MPPQAESITLALRRRVASKRSGNDEPALAYDLRRRGRLAEWLPTAKNLMDKSRWLKWRVALQCGTRKGELVGGANADVNEVCVLCQCDECLQRSSRLPNVGSVPGTAWGRLMTLEGFYEHGMDETLDPDIDEEDSAALCYEYIYARLPGGDDMVRLRDWTRRVFAEHGCAGCLMGKRLHMFWYGDAHNGRIGRWHAARVIDWDRDAGLIKILYEEADYVLDKETRTATGGERTPRWVALGLNFIHWGRPPPVVPEHAWRPLSLPPYEKEQAALVETSSSEEDEDNAEGGGDDGEEDRDMAGTSAAAAAAVRGRVSEPGARRRDGDGGAGKSEEAHRGGARTLGQAAASRFGKGQAGARQRGTAAQQEDEDEEVEVLVSVRGPAVERAATAIRQGKDAAAAAATTLGRQGVAVTGRGAGSSRATAVGAAATVRLAPATFPSRDAAPARGAAKAPAVAAAAQAPDASPQHAQQQQQRHRQQHPQQQLRRQQARGGVAGAQDPQGAREEAANHAGTSEGVGEHGQQEAHGAVPAHQHQQRLEGTPSCRGVDSAGAGMGTGGGEGAIGSGVRPRRPAAAAAANPRSSPLAAEARTGAASEGSFLDVPVPVVLGKRAWRQQDAAAPTMASMDSAAGAATAAAAAAGQAAIMPQSSGLRPHPPRCSADRGGSSEALPTTCLPSQQQQQQQQQGGATASVPAQLQPLSAARALGCTALAAADTRPVAATAPTAAATTAGAARFRPDALAALADMAMAALQAQREARRGASGAPAVAAAAPAPAMAAAATAAVQHPPSGAGAPQAACKGPRRLGSLRDPIMKAQGALAGATAAQGAAVAAADGSGSEGEAPHKRHCSSSLSFWAAVSGSPLGPGGNGPLEGGVGVSAVAASGGAAGAGREQEDAPVSAGLVKGGECTQPEGMDGEEEERGRDGMDVDEGDGVQEHGGEGKGMEGATASEQAALGSPPEPDQGKAAVGGGDDDLAVGGPKDVDPLASPGPVAAADTSAGRLGDAEGLQASHGLRQGRGGEDIDAAAGREGGRGAHEEEEEVEEDAGKGGTDAGAPTGVSSGGNHLLLPGRQDEYYDEREEKAQVLIAQQRVLLEGPGAAAPQHAAAEPSYQGGGNGDGWRAVLHALGLPADAQPLPGNALRSLPPAMTHMLRGISQTMAAMGAPAACVQQATRKARASPTQTFFVYEAVLRHVRQRNVEWTTRLLDEMCHGTWSHALWLQSRRQTEQQLR